ncbi:MAG: YggT family protein [Candidatus Doudnabacteria bacterium]|nr:YggT family protein [Candidatus Doudnabacteria bacterium]
MAQMMTYPTRTVKPIYYGASVVWYIVGIVDGLLGLRFVLRAVAANPAAGFTDFIYRATAPLTDPFINVIRSSRIESGIIEWSTLLAIAVYWLLAWAIVRLFFIARPVSDAEAEQEIKREL